MNTAAFLIPSIVPTTAVVVALITLLFVVAVVACVVSVRRFRRKSHQTRNVGRIMQHAMEQERVKVMRVMMAQGRIVNVYGHSQSDDVETTQAYIDGVHPDDRQSLSRLLTQISLGHIEGGDCHYRRRYHDENGAWQWRYIHNNAVRTGRSKPYDIICTLNDESSTMREQQQERDLSRRYESIFEHSIVGLAIYDNEGMLLAANQNMRQIMHMAGDHDPHYFGISLFNRHPFRDLVEHGEMGEFHFCTKMTDPDRNMYTYLELQLKPQLDDVGRVLHYSLTARDIAEERSLYMKSRENDKQIREANQEIQRYEMELQYLMDRCDMRVWKATFKDAEVTLYKGLNKYDRKLSLSELRTFFIDNEESVMEKFLRPERYFNHPVSFVRRTRSIFHDRNHNELLWNVIDSIPIFDKNGELEGCFGTIRNITPLIEAQELLKEETRRANDSARLKSVFMANMTHEIRTPLNSIVGFSDLLPMIESPEDKKEMIRVIMNNCDMLLRLINDILEISTMDGNAIIINPEEVDFAQVFDDICESLEQRVQSPTVAFIKDNPYDSLYLSIDQRRIQQVITNFVTNAVKYTQQGHIRIGYSIETNDTPSSIQQPSSDMLYIYCEDTGAGIPKEKQNTVFDRFVKLNDYVQGTGLGLSICKAIATRSGGHIGVESEGEGHGSTFWIRVPINKVPS